MDRIAGGITYHKYDFDKSLIKEYCTVLGDNFLGFQLHESASNRRNSDWQTILRVMNGDCGPYDEKTLYNRTLRKFAKMPDGTVLSAFSQDTPQMYSKMHYALTPDEYFAEIKDLYLRRMAETEKHILPCDSYYLMTKIQDELGMNSFMPEVGCQITLMRIEVSLARGIAKASNKTWGVYYECWREIRENGKYIYTMPCFNQDPSNEWYLTQDSHPDDFTSYGKNGGSSRLLQNRIYYYALMSGADYFSEEWGLNCSYSDMNTFDLSDYGIVKKNFINDSLKFKDMKAVIPFAIVLPKDYSCVEIPDMFTPWKIGNHRNEYMRCILDNSRKKHYGHIEDVLKLIYSQTESVGNEGHVITNSRFPDVFDIIYEDAPKEVLSRYEYLIDATVQSSFFKAKGESFRILESTDLYELEKSLNKLIKEVMPCYVDELCWLVSTDKNGNRYLSIFNNEGNERSLEKGDTINPRANKAVKITFKEACNIEVIKEECGSINPEKENNNTYTAVIPAAGFAIIKF